CPTRSKLRQRIIETQATYCSRGRLVELQFWDLSFWPCACLWRAANVKYGKLRGLARSAFCADMKRAWRRCFRGVAARVFATVFCCRFPSSQSKGKRVALSDIDRQLLQRCLARQPHAWEDFVDRFLGLVVHVIQHTATSRSIGISQHDLEDLASEVFIAILA